MFSHVKPWVSGNGDHSWSPLQHQFSAKMLCPQILYVIIHEKSEYHASLTVSSVVVEQQVKKLLSRDFSPYKKNQSRLKQNYNMV
jgi:hypothetical protein